MAIELKKELGLLLVILVLIVPYLLLFYKKRSLGIRLLYVSICEILILCALLIIDFIGKGILVEAIFFYNQFVWISILLNFSIIILSWLFRRERINKSKKNN
jgi:hypothetical protein